VIGFVIPALDPPDDFLQLVTELRERVDGPILVVDDGSSSTANFEGLAVLDAVSVIHHKSNRGKGEALRTAFALLLENPAIITIVTLDADGQHRLDDVVAVTRAAAEDPKALVLGCRAFDQEVPWKSRLGNRLTSQVLRIGYRLTIADSQTGLRAVPRRLAEDCLGLVAHRYGFELEMLLTARSEGLAIREVPITTVYVNQNRATHFRPILDSLGVYLVFLRFSAASLASFVIDILLFTLIYYLSGVVLLSTYAARIASGSFNFLSNRHMVFHDRGARPIWRDLLGYASLAAIVATFSGILVATISERIGTAPALVKIGVDPVLFLISFACQRWIIFRPPAGINS